MSVFILLGLFIGRGHEIMDKEELYRKFLQDELNEQELKFFANWIQSEESNEFLKKKMNFPKDFESQVVSDWNHEEVKGDFLTKIKASKKASYIKKKRRWMALSGIAASIAILIGLFFFGAELEEIETTDTISTMATKANGPGKKTRIQLKDGSVVFLNSDSEISYPENFLANRTVILSGEAFFEVAPHAERPFRVICENVETKALGTSFNIKSFRPGSIDIVLATGKVEVTSDKGETLALLPGQGLRKDQSSDALTPYSANVEKTLFWKSGTLHLENLTVAETIETLERWFGISISIEGSVPPSGRFSGTFTDNEILPNVLNVLQYSGNFSYSIDGKNVKISFKPKE